MKLSKMMVGGIGGEEKDVKYVEILPKGKRKEANVTPIGYIDCNQVRTENCKKLEQFLSKLELPN